ncbi:MAG: hypothetical protein Q8R36_00515 [bacterium]|nr:hypothetical protein [bacterium]
MTAIRREKSRDLFLLVFGTIILVFLVFPLIDVFVLGTEITTSSTVIDKNIFARGPVMSASPAAIVPASKRFVVFFKIDDKICRYSVSKELYRDFKEGQPISIMYRDGMFTGTSLTLLLSCN